MGSQSLLFLQEGAPTWHLSRCPYIGRILNELDCDFTTVAARSMPAGGTYLIHYDWATWDYYRDFRLHIPVHTHPKATFWCNGQFTHMAAGDLFTFDRWSMHSVFNNSPEARIHLILDTQGSNKLRGLLSKSDHGANEPVPQFNKPSERESRTVLEGCQNWGLSTVDRATLVASIRALHARIRQARSLDESLTQQFQDRLQQFWFECKTTENVDQIKRIAKNCIRELSLLESSAFELWPRATTRLALLLGLAFVGPSSTQMFEPTSFLFRIEPTGDLGLWKDGLFHPIDFPTLQLLGAFAQRGEPAGSFGAVGLEYDPTQLDQLVQRGLLRPRVLHDISLSDAIGLDEDAIRQELTTPPQAFVQTLSQLHQPSPSVGKSALSGELPELSGEDRFTVPTPIICRFATEVRGVGIWSEKSRDFRACRWENIWVLSMLGQGGSVSSVLEQLDGGRAKQAIEGIRQACHWSLVAKLESRESSRVNT